MPRESQEDRDDRKYAEGSKAAWQQILNLSMRALGSKMGSAEELTTERASAIATLRDLCEEFGDNDWPDTLNLSDIIDKHLGRYLGGDGKPSGWQPIATAEPDKVVLVYMAEDEVRAAFPDQGQWFTPDYLRIGTPLYWMPIPTPPETKG